MRLAKGHPQGMENVRFREGGPAETPSWGPGRGASVRPGAEMGREVQGDSEFWALRSTGGEIGVRSEA